MAFETAPKPENGKEGSGIEKASEEFIVEIKQLKLEEKEGEYGSHLISLNPDELTVEGEKIWRIYKAGEMTREKIAEINKEDTMGTADEILLNYISNKLMLEMVEDRHEDRTCEFLGGFIDLMSKKKEAGNDFDRMALAAINTENLTEEDMDLWNKFMEGAVNDRDILERIGDTAENGDSHAFVTYIVKRIKLRQGVRELLET